MLKWLAHFGMLLGAMQVGEFIYAGGVSVWILMLMVLLIGVSSFIFERQARLEERKEIIELMARDPRIRDALRKE